MFPLLKKVEKLVKYFHKSPTRNDWLQKYVKEDLGEELALSWHSKTHWNSMVMLKQYLQLHNQVIKALFDFPGLHDLSSRELNIIKDIVVCLEPVKLGAEALCCHDSDFLSGRNNLKVYFEPVEG